MTTLTYGATTITLSDDLLWVDEYAWTPAVQRRGYSVTGSMIVDSGLKKAGRPITLGGDETGGWVSRTTVGLLAAAAAIPGQEFTLTLRGVAYAVLFDHESQAFEAEPIFQVSDPAADDYYVVTLRFITKA